jgi:hypothetical protein
VAYMPTETVICLLFCLENKTKLCLCLFNSRDAVKRCTRSHIQSQTDQKYLYIQAHTRPPAIVAADDIAAAVVCCALETRGGACWAALSPAITCAVVPHRADMVLALSYVGTSLACRVIARLQGASEALARLAYATGRVRAKLAYVAIDAPCHFTLNPTIVGSVSHLASTLAVFVGSMLVCTSFESCSSSFGSYSRACHWRFSPLLTVAAIGADGGLLAS